MWIQAVVAAGAVLAASCHPTSSAEVGEASAIWPPDKQLTKAPDPIRAINLAPWSPKGSPSPGRFATSVGVVVSIAIIAFLLPKCMRLIQTGQSSAFGGAEMLLLAERDPGWCDDGGAQGGGRGPNQPDGGQRDPNLQLQLLEL